MKSPDHKDIEQQAEQLLASLAQDHVTTRPSIEAVLQEVAQQRQLRRHRQWQRMAAIAAVVVLGLSLAYRLAVPSSQTQNIGTVNALHGRVQLGQKSAGLPVQGATSLNRRQWVETRSGSQAEIHLADQTVLVSQPRTALQLDQGQNGFNVQLTQGAVKIQAAKQAPGQALTVETPGTHIRILGTQLDVRLFNRPDQGIQTVTTLYSGSVEIESAGQTALLLPSMMGLTDEQTPPIVQSTLREVNVLIQLWTQTQALARQAQLEPGMPCLIDFPTSTLWAMIPREAWTATGPQQCQLHLKTPAFGAQVFAQDGAGVTSSASGRQLSIDLSSRPPQAPKVSHLILRLSQVEGLFSPLPDASFEFTGAVDDSQTLSLFVLQIPRLSQIESIQGESLDPHHDSDRKTVTLMGRARLIDLYQ